MDKRIAAGQWLRDYLHDLVSRRRSRPGDDLMSRLIAVEESGDQLTEDEIVSTCNLLLIAGHETTVNLIANASLAMLGEPAQWAALGADGERASAVIEETLRAEPPIANLPLRFAVEDIKLEDGTALRKGEAILACYAAAGRDPQAHGADADLFDVTRADKEHMAFGYGVHHCLGAPLARLEAAIALPALFTRFPELGLAVQPSELLPLDSFISNGHRTLPARLKAAA